MCIDCKRFSKRVKRSQISTDLAREWPEEMETKHKCKLCILKDIKKKKKLPFGIETLFCYENV